jgi:broad specificity phosphatase PhoE
VRDFDELLTPDDLREGSSKAWGLWELMEHMVTDKRMPFLIGYDLDDLARRLERAADELERLNG